MTLQISKRNNFGRCEKCKRKVSVPSWKCCADCDFERYRRSWLRKQIKINKKILFKKKTRKDKIADYKFLIVDEYQNVIGYKN